jgi:ribosome biogenesis protein Nip4
MPYVKHHEGPQAGRSCIEIESENIHKFVCKYVHMYVRYVHMCTYVCIFVCMYMCMYVCTYMNESPFRLVQA